MSAAQRHRVDAQARAVLRQCLLLSDYKLKHWIAKGYCTGSLARAIQSYRLALGVADAVTPEPAPYCGACGAAVRPTLRTSDSWDTIVSKVEAELTAATAAESETNMNDLERAKLWAQQLEAVAKALTEPRDTYGNDLAGALHQHEPAIGRQLQELEAAEKAPHDFAAELRQQKQKLNERLAIIAVLKRT